MGRAASAFRKRDVTRAVRAVEAAGMVVGRVVIDSMTGKITLEAGALPNENFTNENEWDAPPARDIKR